MQNLKRSKRLSAFFSVILCAAGISSVSAGWKKIGFAGKEIRALTVGHDVMRDRQSVFVPVDDSGVFMVSGPDDSMYQFPFHGSTEERPSGRIRSLLVAENGATVLAGSDSGLYGTSMYLSSLPMWRKMLLDSTKIVVDMAESDSAFCAVTASGVYHAEGIFATWLPCSLSGEPVRPASGSVFTSITSWPVGKGFVVGSAAAESGAAAGRVIFGSYDARSWTDGSCIEECTCIDADVYSLAADNQITVYAGTSGGVFHAIDFDTGCWHSRSPQLEMPIRDMCLARMNSSGMPPDIYAATDSGVYLKSIQTTASGAWNRLLDMKTFAVEVMEVSGEYIIYAGTIDGLWKYSKSTPVTGMRNRKLPQPAAAAAKFMYSIDGRVVPQGSRRGIRGVYLIKREGCRLQCNVR